jgi:hypothetical protein
LGCFKCHLSELDCSGLDKLRELYCANNGVLVELKIDDCNDLEILDCAETYLSELIISNKLKLETISVKESEL